MIGKIEEENKVYEYMVNDKLPKEIDSKRKIIAELQNVLSLPAIDQNDLQNLQAKVRRRNRREYKQRFLPRSDRHSQ